MNFTHYSRTLHYIITHTSRLFLIHYIITHLTASSHNLYYIITHTSRYIHFTISHTAHRHFMCVKGTVRCFVKIINCVYIFMMYCNLLNSLFYLGWWWWWWTISKLHSNFLHISQQLDTHTHTYFIHISQKLQTLHRNFITTLHTLHSNTTHFRHTSPLCFLQYYRQEDIQNIIRMELKNVSVRCFLWSVSSNFLLHNRFFKKRNSKWAPLSLPNLLFSF